MLRFVDNFGFLTGFFILKSYTKYGNKISDIKNFKPDFASFLNKRTSGPVNDHLRSAAYTNKHV